jgi:hypothetical protein
MMEFDDRLARIGSHSISSLQKADLNGFSHTSHLSTQVTGKRHRDEQDWSPPECRDFLSRVSLESVQSKMHDEKPLPLASFWPNGSSSPAPQPTKSWSSEETRDYCSYDFQPTGPRQSKRFRKYCSHNPYAAQAAAASLLAGAAWLEAVQKLQALNSLMDPVGSKARNSS